MFFGGVLYKRLYLVIDELIISCVWQLRILI
nr:MAG TPA: hypothetical protein [Caudoviricetes sp.]